MLVRRELLGPASLPRVAALPSVAALLCLAAVASGCADDPAGPATGLEGVVLRGPTQPVCMAEEPCEEPFSAGFTVRRDGFVLGRFDSDADGHFHLELPPGGYVVLPDPDAPLLAPESQPRDVTVGDVGLTSVELRFDTGIR